MTDALTHLEKAVNDFWATTLSEIEHSERYHLARKNFWSGLYGAGRGLTVLCVLGAITLLSFLDLSTAGPNAEWAIKLGLGVLAWFIGQGPREAARKRMEIHESLRKDFLDLIRELEEGRLLVGQPKANLTSQAHAKKAAIEKREPDHLRVLQADCLNEICIKNGGNIMSDEYIPVSLFQRLFKHLFDWRPNTLANNEARMQAWIRAKEKRALLKDEPLHTRITANFRLRL